MEKAYDIKNLVDRLKSVGLDVGEEAARGGFIQIMEWLKESAKLSQMPWDDMGLIVLPKIEELALSAIDKIDGQVGG